MNQINWITTLRTKSEEDYKKGIRITLDDCISVCMESLAIHKSRVKNVKLKKHFHQMQKIDVIQLEALMKIKESRESS